MKFKEGSLTIGEVLKPAMEITDQKEADEYLEAMIEYYMRFENRTREQALEIARINLGYFAGYYNYDVEQRVQKLFMCNHQFFGQAFPEHHQETSTFECEDFYNR